MSGIVLFSGEYYWQPLLVSASGRRWHKRIASIAFFDVLGGRFGARTILESRGVVVAE